MRSPVPPLELSQADEAFLAAIAKAQTAPHADVVRAQALLMAGDGLANTAIAAALGVSPSSVANWRTRFADDGWARLGKVRRGRGRKPSIPAERWQRSCTPPFTRRRQVTPTGAAEPWPKHRG
jgi:transposase